ncbi:MAG TPA: long-chain-fatty-acid--CoA ligase [Gaiellaceae bacterium]|nr:long-chain-fatty-acid--CoA ligase [Gaiellaceae bacterium]
MILGEIAHRNARLFAAKPAFVMGDRTVTFAEHDARGNRLANALGGRGLQPGDRVAFLSRNTLEVMDVYGAGEKGGFPVAPLNFRLTPGELTPVLEKIDPRVLFAQSQYVEAAESVREQLDGGFELVALDGPAPPGWTSLEELLAAGSEREPAAEVAPDDVAYLMSTSGTTGTPRAAMLTHQGQWLDAVALALELRLSPEDRHLAPMPLFHVGGHAIVLAHHLRGCTVHLHDGFDAAAVAHDIEAHRITTSHVVPTMLSWLLEEQLERVDLSSLRLVWYASAPMPVELLRRALGRLGPIFIQGYGQTETGPLATSLQPEEHVVEGSGAGRLASAGRAAAGVRVRIVREDGSEAAVGETGEVAVRSDFLMTGYWRDPELTAEVLVDGWVHTGDMAHVDEQGYVYIVDRKKDMIISGGENVFPREVEDVLYAHPAVLEAAVIGVPDATWGESPRAIVVCRAEAEVAQQELIDFCRDRLAHYKCPRSVEFRDELPKTPSGKVLKRALREPDRHEVSA